MGKRIPKFLLVLICLVFIGLLAEGIYYFQLTRVKNQAKSSSRELVATAKIDVFLKPGEEKVGYLIPGQKFLATGEKLTGYLKIIDNSNYQLWIKEDSLYKPVENK